MVAGQDLAHAKQDGIIAVIGASLAQKHGAMCTDTVKSSPDSIAAARAGCTRLLHPRAVAVSLDAALWTNRLAIKIAQIVQWWRSHSVHPATLVPRPLIKPFC